MFLATEATRRSNRVASAPRGAVNSLVVYAEGCPENVFELCFFFAEN